MKKLVYILLASCILFGVACEDVDTRRPFGEEDGTPPGTLSVTSYEKIPGGARIKFVAPQDEDLMYIKIKYTLDNGQSYEARASLYTDILTIEGYGNTEAKTIFLSAVDRSENEGEAISYVIEPGLPSCHEAYEHLETAPAFGGLSIKSINPGRTMLYVDVFAENEEGEWTLMATEYSNRASFLFAIRGFEAEEREFRVQIRDIWGNTSQMYSTTLMPLYEEQLDLSKFRPLILPTDLKMDSFGSIWDLFNGKNKLNEFNMAHSPDFPLFPVWFTFDMGTVAKLSRYKFWQRLDSDARYAFDNGAIQSWEIWGREDTPPVNGTWDGWVKLLDCENVKPSGYPAGSMSVEDRQAAERGDEFEFSLDVPPVRYIRLRALSSHSGQGLVHIQQMWFWGQPIN